MTQNMSQRGNIEFMVEWRALTGTIRNKFEYICLLSIKENSHAWRWSQNINWACYPHPHQPHVISIRSDANNVHYTELALNWLNIGTESGTARMHAIKLACKIFTSIHCTRKHHFPHYSNPPKQKKIGCNLWYWPIVSPHMICHVSCLQFPWESCKRSSHASTSLLTSFEGSLTQMEARIWLVK